MSLDRALALVAAAPRAGYPNPTVGAVLVAPDGTVAGEGVTEAAGGLHGEIVALGHAGERAHGSTLYVTMEPCAHHGRTPPCSEAIVAAGVARVVAGCRDPNAKAAGGLEFLAEAGMSVELDDRREARVQNLAWRTWTSLGRPYVTLKLALSLDGRVVVPGRRWVTGEAARRRVHGLRAEVDAVAVGMGTVRADAPRLDVREIATDRQPRRLAFGRGPLPDDSELELRSGPLAEELAALATEGVQSVLFEGGPTIGAALLDAGLVDRLLVFVAPVLAGGGPHALADLALPVDLAALSADQVGTDVLLEAYVNEP